MLALCRGVWLSLVERSVRVGEVIGSNPVTPTASQKPSKLGGFWRFYPLRNFKVTLIILNMTALHLFTLGRLRMQHEQAMISSFPTRHVEELLGFFVLNPQARHSREKLIDILWPHAAPDNARGRFSTVLWRLRGSFSQLGLAPDAYMQVTREWVRFAPREPVELDYYHFEELVQQARRAIARDASSDALLAQESLLSAAVELYKGDLCEGIYTDWCLVERERLARLYLWTAGQLMACLMQRAAYEEAVNLGRKILAYDPLREEVHRAIMRCYWLTNRPSLAVQQYHQCAHLLQEELQAVPMPETIALYRDIMADRLHALNQNPPQSQPLADQLATAVRRFEEAAQTLDQLLDRLDP
jgi:DNA-binding SARP family transcriptional activator